MLIVIAALKLRIVLNNVDSPLMHLFFQSRGLQVVERSNVNCQMSTVERRLPNVDCRTSTAERRQRTNFNQGLKQNINILVYGLKVDCRTSTGVNIKKGKMSNT